MKVRLTFTWPTLEALGCSPTWRIGRRFAVAFWSTARESVPPAASSRSTGIRSRRSSSTPGRLVTAARHPGRDPRSTLLPVIHQILKDDGKAPRKQRHTARRIFERLRDEHGYSGKLTIVKEAVAAWRRSRAEVFVPLIHRPGEAQVDFGQAEVTLDGQATTVALFVMTLPYSDALFVSAFPRECTEVFLEGHVRAFNFFSRVPRRISYDNLSCSGQDHRRSPCRKITDNFLRLKSHHLLRTTSSSPATQRERACRNPQTSCTPQLPRPRAGSPRRAGVAQHRPGKPLSRRPPPPAAGQARDQSRIARGGAVGPVATAVRGVRSCPGRSDHGRFALPGPLRHQRLLSPHRIRSSPGHHPRRSTPSGLSLATAWWRVTVAAGAVSKFSMIRSTTCCCSAASPPHWTSPPWPRAGSCRSASGSSVAGSAPSLPGLAHDSSSRSCGCWSERICRS